MTQSIDQAMESLATWINSNPNLKGSQQWNDVAAALKELEAQKSPDTSFLSALQLGIDQPLENIATTMNLLGEPGSGDFLSNLTTAPTNYQSAVEKFMNPDKGDFNLGGFGFAYLPRAVTELAGQVAGSMASRIVGATAGAAITPGGKVTKGIGAGVGAFAGPFSFKVCRL